MNVFTMQQDNVMSSSSPVDPNWVFFWGILIVNATIFVLLVLWRDWKNPQEISRFFWLTHPWQYYKRLHTIYKIDKDVGWGVFLHVLLEVVLPVFVFGFQSLGALSCGSASGSFFGRSSDLAGMTVVFFCMGVLFLVTLWSKRFEEIYIDYPATRTASDKHPEHDKNSCDGHLDGPKIMEAGTVREPIPSESHSEKKRNLEGCSKCNNRTDAALVLGAGVCGVLWISQEGCVQELGGKQCGQHQDRDDLDSECGNGEVIAHLVSLSSIRELISSERPCCRCCCGGPGCRLNFVEGVLP